MEENEMKISEFTQTTTINNTDLIPIVQGNETKNITKENLLAELGDLSSLETTDKTNIVSAVNEQQNSIDTLNTKATRVYCVASISNTPTVSTDYVIPLDVMGINTGEFSLSDGGIKIPKGINHIKVNGSIFLNDFPAGQQYAWGRIARLRGSTTSNYSGSINTSTTVFVSSSIPPTVMAVQENDIVKLVIDSPGGGKIRNDFLNTWLMVEKLD